MKFPPSTRCIHPVPIVDSVGGIRVLLNLRYHHSFAQGRESYPQKWKTSPTFTSIWLRQAKTAFPPAWSAWAKSAFVTPGAFPR